MAHTAATQVPVPAHIAGVRPARMIGAAAAGNLLEWYDWGVYGFLVTYIGINFFPSASSIATLLMAFATFGAGFLMRPVGALVIGHVAEKHGRKTALLATLATMAVATLPIAFIPNFERIGLWAPALLLACRLLQGFSTGGELGGALAYLAEWAPQAQRGAWISLQQASTHGGMLLGSTVAAAMNAMLGAHRMADWGWRIPFLLGGLLLPVALWLRRRLDETPVFRAGRAALPRPRLPLARMGMAVCFIAGPVACQYLFFTYLSTFAVQYGGLSQAEALTANAAALGVLVVGVPAMGALSDRVGRRPMLAGASLLLVVLAVPVFAGVARAPGAAAVLAIQAGIAIVVAMYHGASPAAVTELFPTQGRALAVSMSYAIGVALFGGFAPLAAAWLVAATGSTLAPALYLAAACCVTGGAALCMAETARGQLA